MLPSTCSTDSSARWSRRRTEALRVRVVELEETASVTDLAKVSGPSVVSGPRPPPDWAEVLPAF